MGKIQLTPEDLMKGELLKNGWFKASITNVGIKPSKDGESVNYTFTFALENDPDGRSIDHLFNSKGIGFMKPFLAAISGKTIKDFIEEHKTKGVEFDPEGCVKAKLQIKIADQIWEVAKGGDGQPRSKVADFAPYNTQVTL